MLPRLVFGQSRRFKPALVSPASVFLKRLVGRVSSRAPCQMTGNPHQSLCRRGFQQELAPAVFLVGRLVVAGIRRAVLAVGDRIHAAWINAQANKFLAQSKRSPLARARLYSSVPRSSAWPSISRASEALAFK